jgi:4-amino-4-deoxy-L-arabinose transferase-like glycosyltransferase
VINDGKFYSKYSPGWPFFLMFGFLIGIPMVVNLIFSLSSIVVVFLIAKELFSERIAKIAILLMAVSPYFLFNSATYYPQPSVLFSLSFFTYCYIKGSASKKPLYFLVQGILLGIIFNIRQFDAVIIGSCFFVYEVAEVLIKRKTVREAIRNMALVAGPVLILSVIFFYYNYIQSGDPLLTPFTKYEPKDRLGFNTGYLNSFSWAIGYNIFRRLFMLNLWIPFCLFILPAAFILSRKEERAKVILLLLIPVSYLFGYFFFAMPEWNNYGPRYIYPTSFAVFILTAFGLERISSWRNPLKFAVIPVILVSITLTVVNVFLMHEKTIERTAVYSEVEYLTITNAIVFLVPTDYGCSGDMPCVDLTRNGISFDAPVLYVHYQGAEKNLSLMKHFPKRDYYYWHCDGVHVEKVPVLDFMRAKNEHCLLVKIDPVRVEETVKEYRLKQKERN